MIFVYVSGMLDNIRSIPSDLVIIHYASGYQVRFWVLIKLAAALFVISAIVVAIYQRIHAFRAIHSRSIRNKPPDLVSIGSETSRRQQRQWSI